MEKKTFLKADLKGKIVVFTGGTDGMGRVAVDKLAQMGANLIILGRNKQKTIKVVEELNNLVGSNCARYVLCDLASQKSIRNAAKEILTLCPKINLLINCAGANVGTRNINEDGFEMNWAINHLGPFLLTNLLLDRIKSSSPSRIVFLSSATEKRAHMHLNDLQLTKNWSVFKSYAQAKLAMNMCTRKMAKELEGSGVTVNALNPGFIKSNLLHNLKGWTAWAFKLSLQCVSFFNTGSKSSND